jgi:hypothetical protein
VKSIIESDLEIEEIVERIREILCAPEATDDTEDIDTDEE